MFANNKKPAQLSNASARVVESKMILSLPDAISPVVWQMDLNQAAASALEVTPNAENTEFTLSLKATGGKDTKIAKFDNREFAVEGLMAASAALENGHGQRQGQSQTHAAPIAANSEQASNFAAATPPSYQITPTTSGSTRGMVLKIFLGLAALFIMFTLWSMSQTPTIDANGGFAPTASSSSSGEAARQTGGVPVSADDFLRP